MLVRQDTDGQILITQPAHAWLSGQIAREWGNETFGEVAFREEVAAGATWHDIGWIAWEREPTLNPATGLPHTFLQLPIRTHLDIWSHASQDALVFGRYPALLTSLHFTGLYGNRDFSNVSEQDARLARELISSERAFQERLLTSLRADPETAARAAPDVVERNRRLVAVWDAMSLALCHGIREPRTFSDVPAAARAVQITLAPAGGHVAVDPWPFDRDIVELQVDGRRIQGLFNDEETMRRLLHDAEWSTVETILRPG